MRGLFFTGTDTGAGKTHVVAAVARAVRATGRIVRVSKPVATGAMQTEWGWISEDTQRLAEACGCSTEAGLQAITPWMLPEPAAPAVAARMAGIDLRLDDLVAAVCRQVRPGALLLVEGVGGLLCPLTEQHTVADLIDRLGLPAIVVARRSLGTLNHTLLTVEAARQRGLPVAGVVVSETVPPQGLADETNVDELRRRLAVPILCVVPHASNEKQAAAAVAEIDWWRLAEEWERDVWTE